MKSDFSGVPAQEAHWVSFYLAMREPGGCSKKVPLMEDLRC